MPLTVTAAGHVYKQTLEFVYLGGGISADWVSRSVEVRVDLSTPEGMGVLRGV